MVLTEREISDRVALLKRFRAMLEEQRARFRSYLSVLDSQEAAIETGDTDKVLAYAEMEQQVLSEILSLQKVIDPLQEVYNESFPGGDEQIVNLQEGLSRLRDQVLARNESTRAFLTKQKEALKARIEGLNFPRAKRSVYASVPQPGMLDIRV